MPRPRLLDLFCGAGGCSVGYHRAGFDVTGVDINPQPHYPYDFHQADVMKFAFVDQGPPIDHQFMTINVTRFDAIHASPPCQAYSAMSSCRPGLSDDYPNFVAVTRERLEASGVPWVIENVPGSPVLNHPGLFGLGGITLCGTMFGLELYRHRHFESSIALWQPEHPKHFKPGSRAGHWRPGEIISVCGNCSPINLAKTAMGIDWMSRDELAEAIPPAFTEHVGAQLLELVAS